MAAIIPHIEVQEDQTPLENQYATCVGSLNGPNLGEDNPACPSPNAILAASNSGLVGLAFARVAVEDILSSREFTVKAGDISNKRTQNVFMVLDRPAGPGPAWNPTTSADIQQYELLSWTSKMVAPSWSIPAGSPEVGGACPGAVAGQSIVPEERRIAASKLIRKITGKDVNLSQAICQYCYATGGQYAIGHVQFAQVLRRLWATESINIQAHAPDGSPSTLFVETMVYAINNSNFYLKGGKPTKEAVGPEQTGRRFFRIHDSGDFFSKEYLRQWKMVCDRLPDITFWAPSRIWATSWGVDAVNEINARPHNFVIRPSAYEINESPPNRLGPGWAAGTTVIAQDAWQGMTPDREAHVAARLTGYEIIKGGADPRATWNCQAYSVKKGKTCRNAVAPPGLGGPDGTGCRACWLATSETVNYTLH